MQFSHPLTKVCTIFFKVCADVINVVSQQIMKNLSREDSPVVTVDCGEVWSNK